MLYEQALVSLGRLAMISFYVLAFRSSFIEEYHNHEQSNAIIKQRVDPHGI